MRKIETSIEIDASAECVWDILKESQFYRDWNPFIVLVEGEMVKGRSIKITVVPPGAQPMKFKPRILRADFPELRWKGKLLFNGLFDGEHYFKVESRPDGKCLFIHGEIFSGILVGFLKTALEKTKLGFEKMNQSLKLKAENSGT